MEFVVCGDICTFVVDVLSRRVLDRTWLNLGAKKAENDPNLAPQDDPKSTKNRVQKIIKIVIAFKTVGTRFLGRPGGMRSLPGGEPWSSRLLARPPQCPRNRKNNGKHVQSFFYKNSYSPVKATWQEVPKKPFAVYPVAAGSTNET